MKRMKKFLSLLCAGLVLCGSFGELGVQASEPSETSENTTQVRYRPGYIRTLYPMKYHDPVKLPVLYDQEKDTVLVNPEAFFGIFPNYSYTFDQEDRSGEIWLYNRRMAFHAGSDVTAYKISGCEGFFSMSTEAVLWQKQLWVPAKDLLYYLGCQVLPLSITLEETYKPKEDLLVVGDPAYTLLDALADLFKENNGQNWMFSFAKDFGFTSMDQFKLAASAVVADSLYGTVTLDLDTILSWGTQPFTDFYNNIVKLSNTFFDTEWKETGSWYDGKFMRKFLTAMQQPMEEQSTSIAELSDTVTGAISPIISVYAEDVQEHLVNSPEQMAELINDWTWDGKYFNVFKDSIEEFEKTNESYKKLSSGFSKGSDIGGTMATAAYFILSGFEILDQTKNMDQQMMEAMNRYISASKEHSLMPETARSALDTQYALLKSQIAFSMSEVTSNAYNKLIPDFALDALGTGYSLVPTMTKMLWSVFEENQSFLPKVEEPEAMQFATYGMYYESDAWNELVWSYQGIALQDGLDGYEALKECGYLAANYLKACALTQEAGLKSMESSDFANSEAYQATEEKLKKTTALLTQLLTQLRRAEDTKTLDKIPRSYGLLPNTAANSDSNYSYDMLLYPSLMEVDKIYQYSKRPLASPEVTLLPLVNFTDYYEFIHEKLLPEYGYANIGENSIFLEYQNGYQNENWDRRDGILDAAIKDLNGDEVEDLLVFRFGHWDGDPTEGDALGNQEGRRIILEGENRLIAELYSMDENGEIFLAGRQALGSYSGLTGEWLAAGITEIDGTTYLYTESYSNALFADGFYLGYDFYEYTKDGAFRPCMSVCKSDGGSSGIAYSVLQREGEEKWRKTVLQGDGEFRMYTDDKIFFNEDISVRIALDYGFSVLGFPSTLNDMELYSEYPTYMENEELIEPLFHLLCQGDNGNGGWSIHTEVKEQSDFRWVMKMLFGDENDAPDTVPGRPFPNTTTTS